MARLWGRRFVAVCDLVVTLRSRRSESRPPRRSQQNGSNPRMHPHTPGSDRATAATTVTGSPRPAAPTTLDALWRTYKSTGDTRLREQLILHYSPLVKYVAGRVSV